MKLYIIKLVQWKSFKVAMKKGRLENTTRILEMSVSAAWFYKIFQLEIIKHRQKLVMLADSSELGWRVVHEYETNPIVSDSEDEMRIFKAEARANRNANAEKSKKGRRYWPYTRRAETAAVSPTVQSTRQRPGLCFLCGKPGHWKDECAQTVT